MFETNLTHVFNFLVKSSSRKFFLNCIFLFLKDPIYAKVYKVLWKTSENSIFSTD
jgi:hypothetical protein